MYGSKRYAFLLFIFCTYLKHDQNAVRPLLFSVAHLIWSVPYIICCQCCCAFCWGIKAKLRLFVTVTYVYIDQQDFCQHLILTEWSLKIIILRDISLPKAAESTETIDADWIHLHCDLMFCVCSRTGRSCWKINIWNLHHSDERYSRCVIRRGWRRSGPKVRLETPSYGPPVITHTHTHINTLCRGVFFSTERMNGENRKRGRKKESRQKACHSPSGKMCHCCNLIWACTPPCLLDPIKHSR